MIQDFDVRRQIIFLKLSGGRLKPLPPDADLINTPMSCQQTPRPRGADEGAVAPR